MSFAAADSELANTLIDFLRLGCDLGEKQVFCTGRPGALQPGMSFTDTVREALTGATMSIHLLTLAYYESHFCLGELGAVWINGIEHVPLLVPPVDYASLNGVQLGEQALKLDSSTDLDELRDRIGTVTGRSVQTGQWNRQKELFLNKWDGELRTAVALPKSVSGDEHRAALERTAQLDRELVDANADRERLQRYSRDLLTQNQMFREGEAHVPPPPILEGDPMIQWVTDAKTAIDHARETVGLLPVIAREALFQQYHDGQPLTVGGYQDRFPVHVAQTHVEQGWLTRVEDAEQMVTPRTIKPEVDAADSALRRVREIVFDASSSDSTADAPAWARPFLKDEYGITDPKFELRPVWEALDLL